MRINPETLKKLRNKNGLSQQTLADESGVSKKTIARIEGGKEKGEPRGDTVRLIAKALRVKPEVLAEEPESEVVNEEFRKIGARRVKVKVPIFDEAILAYDLVEKRYGVDMRKLINAAPVLFTLLAEMSLVARRRRLTEMDKAWHTFLETCPEHLKHLSLQGGCSWDEEFSIDKRDLFGRDVLEKGELLQEIYHEGQNPFSDFLIQQTKELGHQNDAINLGDMMISSGHPETDGWLWHLPLFRTFRERLTGERRTTFGGYRSRADFALSRGYVRIGQIPKHLRGEDEEEDEHIASERVKWLEAQVPDEDWDEYGRFEDSIKAFGAWRKNFAAGSARADYALLGYVELDKIPQHLHGEDESTISERVKWLEAQVPDEDWEEYRS